MSYDIKLYAHGVPSGQKDWGVSKSDSNFISSFYGRKSTVPVQMIVEIKQLGSDVNCYYTYFRVGNFCDYSGRPGGYFALTLRLNHYYADIKNMYSILDAAYNKYIIGYHHPILSTTNNVSKYLVSDFSQSNDLLSELEKEIRHYLFQFSTNSDFKSLNDFKSIGQNELACLYLLDCEDSSIANYIKNGGCLSVSPYYYSNREQNVIQEKDAKIAKANERAEQQISIIQQDAQKRIDSAVQDKENGIQAVKNEYGQQIQKLNKKISELENNLNQTQQEKSNLEKQLEQYQKPEIQLNKLYDIIEKISPVLPKIEELAEFWRGTDLHNRKESEKPEIRNSVFGRFRKKLYSIFNKGLNEPTNLSLKSQDNTTDSKPEKSVVEDVTSLQKRRNNGHTQNRSQKLK